MQVPAQSAVVLQPQVSMLMQARPVCAGPPMVHIGSTLAVQS